MGPGTQGDWLGNMQSRSDVPAASANKQPLLVDKFDTLRRAGDGASPTPAMTSAHCRGHHKGVSRVCSWANKHLDLAGFTPTSSLSASHCFEISLQRFLYPPDKFLMPPGKDYESIHMGKYAFLLWRASKRHT